jgi:hypothetical protein
MRKMIWLLFLAWFGLLAGNINDVRADEAVTRMLDEAQKILTQQQTPPPSDTNVLPGTNSDYELRMTALNQYHQQRIKEEENELIEVVILCVLALVSLAVVLWYLFRAEMLTADHIINITGLIFIIQGTIILVLMAKTDEQLTAAIGILGAVAGYLFGTMRRGDARAPARERDTG